MYLAPGPPFECYIPFIHNSYNKINEKTEKEKERERSYNAKSKHTAIT